MRQVFGILLICFLTLGIFAQNSKRISDLEQKRKEALESVERTTKMLSKNKATTKNTLYRLSVLNEQITLREKSLSELNAQLTTINAEVSEVQSEYTELSRRLSVKKEMYAKSLRQMSRRNQSEDKLMFILSAKDLNQLTRRLRYLDEFAGFQRVQANEISRKQTELNEKRISLELVYREKNKVKSKQQQEESLIQRERGVQSELVTELKGQEKSLNSELSKQKKQADQLNRQIENVIQEEARKAAELALKDKSRVRTPEIKGGYAMTVEEKQLSGDFGKNQGVLPFPVSEAGTIVVHFGEQKYQGLTSTKNVQYGSKDIQIRTKPGASALAVFGGIVSRIFSVSGANISVMIRHGNFLTVYANLSEVYVKSGEKVRLGQSIGKIYVDGEQNNETIMHFQIWREMERLNPELWLRKR